MRVERDEGPGIAAGPFAGVSLWGQCLAAYSALLR